MDVNTAMITVIRTYIGRQWDIERSLLDPVRERLAARGVRDLYTHCESSRYMDGFKNWLPHESSV